MNNCTHCFHAACIDKWFARSVLCPNCKRAVCKPEPPPDRPEEEEDAVSPDRIFSRLGLSFQIGEPSADLRAPSVEARASPAPTPTHGRPERSANSSVYRSLDAALAAAADSAAAEAEEEGEEESGTRGGRASTLAATSSVAVADATAQVAPTSSSRSQVLGGGTADGSNSTRTPPTVATPTLTASSTTSPTPSSTAVPETVEPMDPYDETTRFAIHMAASPPATEPVSVGAPGTLTLTTTAVPGESLRVSASPSGVTSTPSVASVMAPAPAMAPPAAAAMPQASAPAAATAADPASTPASTAISAPGTALTPAPLPVGAHTQQGDSASATTAAMHGSSASQSDVVQQSISASQAATPSNAPVQS